jgi:hypothetical protein
MKRTFACPLCGASGSVDDALIGMQIRCLQCNHRFVVPGQSEGEDEGYSLAEPTRGNPGGAATRGVYFPSLGDEPAIALSPLKPRRVTSGTNRRPSRGEESGSGWRTWSIRLGIVLGIVLVVTALCGPRGLMISGSVLLIIGTAMVFLGFAAGAYGAFSEDFLYGLLYMVFGIYTAYYFVTRWDDLWKWALCSTAGFGLVAIGTLMVQWSGLAV